MAKRGDMRRETRDEGDGRDERRETRDEGDGRDERRERRDASHVSRLASSATEAGETLGGRIRRLRKEYGMKQRVLATEAEVSVTQLCHLERDTAKPSLRTLERIAAALGTTTGELLRERAGCRTANPDRRGGDALASDALGRGWEDGKDGRPKTGDEEDGRRETGDESHVSRPMSVPSLVSRLASGGTQEPESKMLFVHDPRDLALDRRTRKRLAKEAREWKAAERAAGFTGCATLPLFFPAAAEHGALLAREVRTAGGLGPAAIADPVAFFSGKGIRVTETKLPPKVESWALWDGEDGNAFVFLRTDATEEKKRFRLAYEMGCVARLVSGWMRPVRDLRVSRKSSRAFAAAFLLPEEAVREAAHGLAIGPEDWTWELVLALKERFGVSAETFLYRIEELGMLSRSRNRAFRRLLEEHYARCRAAGKKDLEPRPAASHRTRLALLRLRQAGRVPFATAAGATPGRTD